jgi:hypothetical protein
MKLHVTVLPKKLTGPQLINQFPAFYGIRRFITALTNARHLSVYWAKSVQSIPNLMSPFHCLCRNKESVEVRGLGKRPVTPSSSYDEKLLAPRRIRNRGTTPYRLSANAYSTYSQPPSISGDRSSIRNLRTNHAVVTGTHLIRHSANHSKENSKVGPNATAAHLCPLLYTQSIPLLITVLSSLSSAIFYLQPIPARRTSGYRLGKLRH